MSTSAVPKLYLVIANISKSANVKSLLLAAAAFGCHAVLIVGQTKNLGAIEDEASDHQNKAKSPIPIHVQERVDSGDMVLIRFPKWRDCMEFIRSRSIRLVGVEIDEKSRPIDDPDYFSQHQPFDRDTALVMGNEGQGLHPNHLKACDALVMLAQYGSGTASFNVSVAASMVLYRFYNEQERQRREGELKITEVL